MNRINLLFETSPWFAALCVLAAVGFAALLYYRVNGPWPETAHKLFAAGRFILVLIITLLLLSPLLRQIFNVAEPPALVIALDNSASLSYVHSEDTLRRIIVDIETLTEQAVSLGYEVELRTFNQNRIDDFATVNFDEQSTHLEKLLDGIRNDYESKNLSSVVLLSDGIYNMGTNPLYKPYSFPIFTVGLGDTIPQADVRINALMYNKIAYQGNKFPLVAEVVSTGLKGRFADIEVSAGGKVLQKKRFEIKDEHQFDEITFTLEAADKGIQQFIVQVVPVEGEFTTQNNRKDAFIEVIEGKEKILIASPTPHPDIKAIRSALSKNQNYEIDIFIPGIHQLPVLDEFSAFLLHNVPDQTDRFNELLNYVKNNEKPVWYFIGPHSKIDLFNAFNQVVRISRLGQQTDNVFPRLNPGFRTFSLDESHFSIFDNYTPVKVPFGSVTVNDAAEVLLFQRIGNVASSRPLMVIQGSGGPKTAVMLGDGMWQWRLQEFSRTEAQDAFDNMVLKVVQFLAAKDDKRRFRVYPLKNEYNENETVIFEAEVYNEIYERTYNHKVDLVLKSESGDQKGYTFVTSEQNSRYSINNLPEGIYSFEASATINGVPEKAEGKFAIKELQLETTFLTANHNLMRNLASSNAGSFFKMDDFQNLTDELLTRKAVSKLYSTEDYLSVINLRALFFILLMLASLEWFFRKYYGGY
ncbi:MAG: hypothetical protein JJU28_17745 [Cyclobacteriaceae bacterium]|nr:hypothetical protein [Cyclobacteriaceae bacterium]